MPQRFKKRLKRRSQLTTLKREIRMLKLSIAARDHSFSARIHQFSNMLMGFEQRLLEIADFIEDTLLQSNNDKSS